MPHASSMHACCPHDLNCSECSAHFAVPQQVRDIRLESLARAENSITLAKQRSLQMNNEESANFSAPDLDSLCEKLTIVKNSLL
jgi:hypothetical protein